MRLQELTTKSIIRIDEGAENRVRIFLRSSFFELSGTWQWDMATDALFCSDVMFAHPPDFTGTKAIFHPDDTAVVSQQLTAGNEIHFLRFRIITTYGEIKTITGENIIVAEDVKAAAQWQHRMIETLFQEQEQKAAFSHLQLLRDISEQTGRFSHTGFWYFNTATHHTWYSDYVFRLHGLPPQSLNAHLHTFYPFIHPEDRETVTEFMDRAFQEKTPLHLDYRIATEGVERWVSYKSRWFYSEKGEAVIGGVFQDITEQKGAEQELEAYKNLVQFQRQQALYDEQQVRYGHWQINLLTRKATYSDQYHRIFGIKPGLLAPTITAFLNYVHPDDREMVEATYRRIVFEHTVPDMEFRIIRPDGKWRHVLQRARLLMYEEELLISGILQDVTVQRQLERKVADLQEKLLQNVWLHQQGDEVGNLVGWVMDKDEKTFTWSESFYKLVGYQKLLPQNMTEKTVFSLVHPHDVKIFRQHWDAAVEQGVPASFDFRIMNRGAVHYMKAVFQHQVTNDKTFFVGTLRDTTGEQVLQQQLSQRVQLAESLTENILDRVIITDSNNIILLWNRACEQAYGLKKAEAIGQNFFDVFPHLKTEAEIQRFQQVQRGEKVVVEAMYSSLGNGYYNQYLLPLYQNASVTGVLHVLNDVTKEVELRQSLHERLQLIESIVQSSLDRIIALDRHLNYLYWNKRAEEYYGLRKEEVIGKNILDVFPRMVNDPSYPEIRRALRGETVHLPVAPDQGKLFETYLIPIKNNKSEVSTLLWVAHDLTRELELQEEQQKAQQQLLEEHRRLKEAQAIGQVGSFEWNAATDTLYWSDEMYRIHGLEPQSEVITLERVLSFLHDNDKAMFLEKIEQCRHEACSLNITHCIKRADGEIRIVNRKLQSFADENGKVIYLSGTIQDITERKQVEEALVESKLFTEQVMEATPDFIIVFSFISNRIEYVNRSGYKGDDERYQETLQVNYEQLMARAHPDDREVLHQFIETLRKATDDTVRTVEYRVVKGEEVAWYRSRGKVFKRDEQQNPTHYISVVQDITEPKKAVQELLRLKDELAQKASDKYLTLFNVIDEGFYLAEVIFDEANRPVDIFYHDENPAAVRIVEKSIKGKKLTQVNPAYEKHWFEVFGRVALTGESKRLELHSELDKKWFSFYVTRIGDVTSRQIAIVFQDVTKQKVQEQSQQFRLKLFDEIGSLSDLVKIEETVTALAMEHFGADCCYYCAIEADDAIIRCDAHREGLPSVAGVYSWNNDLLWKSVINAGKYIVVEDVHTSDIVDESVKQLCMQRRVISFLNVPVIKEGKPQGILCITQTTPRTWTDVDIALAEEIAERTWAVVERAKASLALQQSEERFRNLVESFALTVWETNAEGIMVEDSPSWRAYTGQTFDEWKGFGWLNAIHPDDREKTEQGWREAIVANLAWYAEFRLKHAPDKWRWTSARATPLLDAEGNALKWVGMNMDIQRRKEAEEKLKEFTQLLEQQVKERTYDLKESLDFTQEITQIIPDLITIDDAATNEVLYTNHEEFWKDFYGDSEGYKAAEEKRTWGLIHADDREKLDTFRRERNMLHDNEVKAVELRMQGDKWIQIRSKVFKHDEKGAAVQIISFISDITEAKIAELEEKKNLAILQHVEDLAQMGSWEYDLAAGNFKWSEGMYKLFGLPPGSKVTPETYLDFAAEEDRSVAKRIIKNLKKGRQPFEEMLHIKRAGRERLLQIKASVVLDEAGKAQRMVGVDVDITDIKEAEKQLEESRDLLEQTAQASPDAVTIYDFGKKQPVYLNNCLAEWVGTTTEELVARGIEGRLQLIHADDRLRLLHFNEKLKLAKDGQVLTLEYRLHAKNDTLLWIRNRSKPFRRDVAGNVTHTLSVLQDITEEKASERVLKALNASLEKKNAELESKNEEITSFAFVASHDLREPLRKIHTFSDWLLTKELSLSAPGRQAVEKMASAVKKLDMLISDILAISKVHAGNEKVKPVDLNALLQQVKTDLHENLEQTGAVIDAEHLPLVTGSENQLLYLLKNLVSNGIKFQPKQGQPHLHIWYEKDGEFGKLSVKDNGIGIQPEYHKKVFQMFRRLHPADQYEGTGMGLAICKKIMEKHGGKITLESRVGEGTTFTCWFPLALST